ncbi:transporter substrate-binding domain-containing protein [Streptosporangium sandarakinum]|uniref:transporter substrate-binding domain-containing protein n=1 Tax=Streptosporangium sandarakinum TaxID=1260955 RepID=UPI0033BB56B8
MTEEHEDVTAPSGKAGLFAGKRWRPGSSAGAPDPRADAPPHPPADPDPGPDPFPRPEPQPVKRFRRFRIAAWIALVLAAAVVGASVLLAKGPPTEAELRERAGLFNKDRLRIGVKSDTPGIALKEQTGSFTGFDIEIAYMIAADLGFSRDKIDFLAIETEDRARMWAQDEQGRFVKVDLVVASFSVTSKRRENTAVGFSTPYLYTEQSVVTRDDSKKITSLRQLKGKKVCTLGTSTSAIELEQAIGRDVDVDPKNLLSDCIKGLKNREYEAVTTDAALLAGFVAEPGSGLLHHDIALDNTEMWAVNAGPNTALRTLVDLSLYRSYADPQDQRWEDAYKTHIEPLLAANPGINAAEAEQPCARAPEVRRWPWERTLPAKECPTR